jgi:hypothetical protein
MVSFKNPSFLITPNTPINKLPNQLITQKTKTNAPLSQMHLPLAQPESFV